VKECSVIHRDQLKSACHGQSSAFKKYKYSTQGIHAISMKMLSQEFSFSEARTGLFIGGINLRTFWLLSLCWNLHANSLKGLLSV
jgi:hypothetical protein